jgi:hypothetical protein
MHVHDVLLRRIVVDHFRTFNNSIGTQIAAGLSGQDIGHKGPVCQIRRGIAGDILEGCITRSLAILIFAKPIIGRANPGNPSPMRLNVIPVVVGKSTCRGDGDCGSLYLGGSFDEGTYGCQYKRNHKARCAQKADVFTTV